MENRAPGLVHHAKIFRCRSVCFFRHGNRGKLSTINANESSAHVKNAKKINLRHLRNAAKENTGSVAGWRGLHIAPGIYRRIVHAHFVVHVRPRGTAADAAVADDLAALDARTGNRRKRRQMRVP